MYISKSIFGPAAKRPLMMKRQGSAALTAASKILRRTKKAPTVVRKRAAVRKFPAARQVGSPKPLPQEPPTCSSLYAGVSDKWKAVISDAIMDAVAKDTSGRRSRHNSASSVGSGSCTIVKKKTVQKPAVAPREPATCSSLYAGVSDQWKALISNAIMDAVTVDPNNAVQGRRRRHGSGSSVKNGSSGSRVVFKRKHTKKPASQPNPLKSLPQKPATCSLFAGVSDKWKALISDAIMDAVSRDPNVIHGRRNRRGSVSSVESGSSESSGASSVVSSASSTGSRKSTGEVAKVTRTANGRVSKLRGRRVQKAVKRLFVKPKAEKIKREKIEDDDFFLNQLNWSSWKPAMAPVAMDTKQEWIERRGERPGVRNVDLFTSNCHKPAVYEFAVQPPRSDNIHPVLSRATAGFTGNHWDTKLLNGLSVEAQVDRVLKRGCKVFVRRAPFSRPIKNKNAGEVSTLNELRSLIQKTYDYAWQEHYDVPSRKYFHRNVRRDGAVISDNPPEWM